MLAVEEDENEKEEEEDFGCGSAWLRLAVLYRRSLTCWGSR